ncbi:hypothetical protein [Streptomyces sp. NBRC 109706]|uniref:hypothetical protein n=1 Tax=Streptomyces sp. NBRC 109706 TaxID=1550035 RepID=UPI000785843B|nr:hypothetical protein [Streptomyces sp. NBRC 109706]
MAESERATTRESYAFACLSCGYSWEQRFEVELRTGPEGERLVRYLVGGRPVPSPLTHPSCPNCGGHRVRVLPAGTVDAVRRGPGSGAP